MIREEGGIFPELAAGGGKAGIGRPAAGLDLGHEAAAPPLHHKVQAQTESHRFAIHPQGAGEGRLAIHHPVAGPVQQPLGLGLTLLGDRVPGAAARTGAGAAAGQSRNAATNAQAPIFTVVIFAFLDALEGKDWEGIKAQVKLMEGVNPDIC